MQVRDATAADLEPIRSLYNALLLTTTIAWSETPQTAEEREAWFVRQTAAGFPILVAGEDGEVAGFAAYGGFRGAGRWPGYRFTVEHTIHVGEANWGAGSGSRPADGAHDARRRGRCARDGRCDRR